VSSLVDVSFAAILVLALALYVVLDGFDLGVGVILPFTPLSEQRSVMIASLEPFWDGNETWLVLGGMILLAGFPTIFSVLLPAFYVPLLAMLVGLILRGVALEFRTESADRGNPWSVVFSIGSLLAVVSQGFVVGGIVEGRTRIVRGSFAGGPMDWWGLFPLCTGLGLTITYALLGATWLIWRTGGSTQTFGREISGPLLALFALALVLVSLWTPLLRPDIAARWFSPTAGRWIWCIPALTLAMFVSNWRARWRGHDWVPFVSSVGMVILGLFGLVAGIWPNVLPALSTSAPEPLGLGRETTLAGAVLILPIILAYTTFGYWVFRRRTQ
jgi:cytochrome bd ubiquinol oxidase subunit II